MNTKLKKYLKIAASLIFMAVLIYFLEAWGIVGILIFILVISIKRFWFYRSNFYMMVKNLEGMIWGKPLDRKMWDKGELKNTKVEIMYKGKKVRPLENKHFAALFFVVFLAFFFLFVYNKYTINIIISFIFLQLAMGSKTWQIIREVQDELTITFREQDKK